ncbi:DUF7687 domain-containing protein [Bifidobacterium cuniculi]|uniref:Yga2E n=1 Tax=Bifidobacterium cuniculi TaxID=1688 RepID=A0A087AZI7_9BIFI|nr:hypothetical protein [Bifidobacterium cuniculi]KFI64187.1 Yga2E [Bifidobacterium cuniculi]
MKANPRFENKGMEFWAYVRAITQTLNAAKRGEDKINPYSLIEILESLRMQNYPTKALGDIEHPTQLAVDLAAYFEYRANVLNTHVRKVLMRADEAEKEFSDLCKRLGVGNGDEIRDRSGRKCAIRYDVGGVKVEVAMNKQKNEKRAIQYFTGMIDLTVADSLKCEFDYDPHQLATIGDSKKLYATMARRMDGAFPSTHNPRAVWEIKEYYYTTTFGSKISDAVYVTQLDGYERDEIKAMTGDAPQLLLMVDAYDTWWGKGKSYLCRLIDILNMGKVDYILFGREVISDLPSIAKGWLRA